MADEDSGRELPQRVRGEARSGSSVPAAPPSPVLSEELRQRMLAAVTAERSGAATKQDEAPGSDAPSPKPGRSVRHKAARREPPATPQPSAASEPPAAPKPPATPQPPAAPEPHVRPVRAANAGPIPEDEITQWIGTTAKPPSPVRRRAAGRSRSRRAARFVAVVLVIGVLAVAAVSYLGRSSATSPTSAAAARQAAKARAAAASWVAHQVSRGVQVSCDRVMCAALRARGFPSGQLLVLGSASQVPTSSAVVVETPAVLRLFGSSLATAFAPAVLASFGSGPSLVTVRLIARGGTAAYQTLLDKDLRQRKIAGAALLGDSLISLPALAENQLSAGLIDSRLVLALADLAGHEPITIVQFGTDGPGVSVELPLRFVDLAENVKAAHLGRAAYVKVVRDFLAQVKVSYRPASMTTVGLPDGDPGLRVTVSAPSPLGVFGTPSGP
jgi:hypothetical protein